MRPSLGGDTTSSTAVVSEGNNFPTLNRTSLNLAHHEVILGYASEINAGCVDVTIAMVSSDVVAGRPSSREELRGFMSESVPLMRNPEVPGGSSGGSVTGLQTYHACAEPAHYFQHSNFGSQPFNVFTGPLSSSHNFVQPQYGFVNQSKPFAPDPLMMTYTGPYTTASPTVSSQVSLPFAVPTYFHSHGFTQPYSVALTFSITTTPIPQQPYILPQFAQVPPQYYQGPYVDPNLPR